MEGEGFVVGGDLPAEGKAGFHLLGDGVVADKGIQKKANESSRGGILGDQRIEGGGLARRGIDEDASAMSRFHPGGVDALGKRGILPGSRLFRGTGDED